MIVAYDFPETVEANGGIWSRLQMSTHKYAWDTVCVQCRVRVEFPMEVMHGHAILDSEREFMTWIKSRLHCKCGPPCSAPEPWRLLNQVESSKGTCAS